MKKDHHAKFLVTGGKRTGTTLLCAILANAGADFGLPRNREWYRGSGDYEHPIMIANYKYLKRSQMAKSLSDSLVARMDRNIQGNMEKVLAQVDYIKYPPLSQYLPIHMKRAGHEVRLLVTIRRFNTFAMSAVAKRGGSFDEYRDTYLSTYKTNLLNLHLYGGCAVLYEHIVDRSQTVWSEYLGEVTGIPSADLLSARDEIIKPTASRNRINETVIDRECEELYDTYARLSETLFEADVNKQHRAG